MLNNTPITKSSYDKSIKEFEILNIIYIFDKKTRKLINNPKWVHYKYYKTIDSASDAIRDYRLLSEKYESVFYNNPSVILYRYKIIKRDI